MKFKIDENLPKEVADLLRSAGHKAATVGDERLLGSKDRVLAIRVKKEQEAFITQDMHFADIRAYPPGEYPGIIVLRIEFPDKPQVLSVVSQLLPLLRSETLAGNLWIVEKDRVRMRKRPPQGGLVVDLPLDTQFDEPAN